MYSLRRKLLKLDKCFIEMNVNRIIDSLCLQKIIFK